jgi:hypothetical protein
MEIIIWEILVYICKFPGAIFLHAITGFKKPVNYYLNHKNGYGVGILGLVLIIGMVYVGLRLR